MNAPSIGELRDEVTLQQQVRTPGDGGGGALSWQSLETLWARVRPLAGHETVLAGQIHARVTHDVWIRARIGTSPAMRFVRDGRILAIFAVMPAGPERQWMRCLCRELTPTPSAGNP